MKNKNGFVVSAVLYPLLVLFLALIMGLLAMTDTRKRILDKMKLEISDSIFDDAECSCDTILNKLNYLIKNGVGGGGNGSYGFNVLGLNVKGYETPEMMPNTGNAVGDIAVITDIEVTDYYVSQSAPENPKEGNVWIVQDVTSAYHVTSDYSNIGVSYVMQYIEGKWILKKAYVYDEAKWKLLYYVPVKDGIVDLTGSDINAETEWKYDYTGEYQTFTARFSGYYRVELWGAQGGSYGGTGGKGGYTKGEIYLNAGEMIYVYVGEQPSNATGGWNGGGNGYSTYGRGGGGATDIRLANTSEKNIWNEFDSLKSRIMVAAGGGGSSYGTESNNGANGGAGGGLTGTIGGGSKPGTEGTQSAGGYNHTHPSDTGRQGGFGYGGIGYYDTKGAYQGGGGGGGYYGGGGGIGYSTGSGGGGSSYISGYEGCSSISLSLTTGNENIHHVGRAIHESNYYFKNAEMKGNENTGNGRAQITLLTIEVHKTSQSDIDTYNKLAYHFSYNGIENSKLGKYQTFIAPDSGYYKVELWGAQGGSYGGTGGAGGYTTGKVYLSKGTKLYIYVGSMPNSNINAGGWNGGGDGYSTYGRGGGGATDIRLTPSANADNWKDFESLKSRIMVAAGGGGASYGTESSNSANGGAGGGLTGSIGSGSKPGTGGTQSAGGYNNNHPSDTGRQGGFGYGGIGYYDTKGAYQGGGGGGGYYGGGGGIGYSLGSGGGGSSYISGYDGCSSITEDTFTANIVHNGSAYHYSGYYFTEMEMKSGENTGNGRAKIQLLTKEEEIPNEVEQSVDKNLIYNYYYSGTSLTSGRYQIFNTTKSGYYKIEAYGSKGGSYSGAGGLGGYTSGEIYLSKGTKLYIYVGSIASSNTNNGGWNGGGNGYSTYGRGGGGATDIRVTKSSTISSWSEEASLKSRIMVAAGGGGASYGTESSNGANGGAGGGLTGYIGGGSKPGTGGTQSAGGYNHTHPSDTGRQGGFGYGGIGYYDTKGAYQGGGGGGGYYGGGGGIGYSTGSGGGGSSYISGHAGCIAINSDGSPLTDTYSQLSDSISFTNYKFINTIMIDGAGYQWTTEKSSVSGGMTSADGNSLVKGNDGNGYARITYLGA